MPDATPTLNQRLCDSKSPLPVREYYSASIRKLSQTEVSEWKGKSKVSESVKNTIESIYEAKGMQTDIENGNGRIYTSEELQQNINRLTPTFHKGSLVGTSGHPSDFESYLGDPSVIAVKWVDLQIDGTGEVLGKFVVIPTEKGKDLQVVLDHKLSALGFSSYGFSGARRPTEADREKYGLEEDTEAVIMQGFVLEQLDAVRGPSVPDARVIGYPEATTDSLSGDNKKTETVSETAQQKKARLSEACSTGLHWTEIGSCGCVLASCECDVPEKHFIYSQRECEECMEAGGSMDAAQFKKHVKESKSLRVSEAKVREPLAKSYTQYIQHGKDAFSPAGPIKLNPNLSSDAFDIVPTFDGIRFVRHVTQTDELYHFAGSPTEKVLEVIDNFWKSQAEYEKYGVMHHLGVMLYGPPGNGKTTTVNQVVDMITDRGDAVFYGRNISTLMEGLTAFREVEPDRKVVVILEDADEYIGYQERDVLNLLDGANTIEGCLYLATTNYLNRFPERLLRPGRFDRKVFVGPPPLAGREAYLNHKIGKVETAEEIKDLANQTDGLSFAHLRELITAVYALKEPKAEVLARLTGRSKPKPENLSKTVIKESVTHPIVYPHNQKHLETEKSLENLMPIKTLDQLATEAPEVHAAHVAAIKEASDKAVASALNSLIETNKSNPNLALPSRDVLPAEVKAEKVALETKVSVLEAAKNELATKLAETQTKLAESEAKEANRARAIRVGEKAKPIIADNAYVNPLKKALKAELASNASFDADKVEAFIESKLTEFDEISGQTNKGKKSEGTVQKVAGRIVSDDEQDALEAAVLGDNLHTEESKTSSALSEAFKPKSK